MAIATISALDWWVIGFYLVGLISFSLYLSRRQHSRADYYVGGRSIGAWPIAISTMATQCSTNSILGAPAFVAFSAGGGLIWLQYELAVPLAMLAIMIFLLPVFRAMNLVSVYEYLERRFDLKTRLVLSGLFQFLRAFATSVTIYSIALVVELITGTSFLISVLILGAITLIYDVFGGVKGVVYSDVLQMGILVVVLVMLFVILVGELGGLAGIFNGIPEERLQTLDFSHHGFGDGETFAFWPMLIGGFFLYVSYYGCDQSQVQRELCAANIHESKKSLFLNGLLRFPLVLLYCLIGVGLASYAANHPEFIQQLPTEGDTPNYNVAVPLYMLQVLPAGLVGLALVALFAAAMSSLDSVINSLSASTMEDFVRRLSSNAWSDETELWISRVVTLCWGSLAVVFSFYVGDIADSVLVAINKIGSLINGPVLGVFLLGIFTRRCNGLGAVCGLCLGFVTNVLCWLYLPDVSWLWWNVIGLIVCILGGYLTSLFVGRRQPRGEPFSVQLDWQNWRGRYGVLVLYTLGIVGVLAIL
ncbi:sodium:solute symporter [Teredinibacter turnerae]|uniref:sodium:solute symporter n=1 Tax=Teredinibacter turnerae TaxID=2426 RepID=UPI00037FDC6A|nr:sodium:solute symporter [Teredinibacter turnerae]